MGGVTQQINLYRGPDPTDAPSSGARTLLFTGLAALATVLSLAIGGEFYLLWLDRERNDIASGLQRQQAEMTRLADKLSRVRVDPVLQSELAGLRAARKAVQRDLAAIARHQGASGGFSSFFGGLARNTLDGLWLNNVGVAAGGAELRLEGQATAPELVPRLLQSLSAEPAFAGRTFREVRFERQEHDSGTVVDFQLRSARGEEVDDAG